MEQSKKLSKAYQDYMDALSKVEAAADFSELDALRLKALAAFQEMERQLNRARPELLKLCRIRRAEISQARALERGNSVTRLTATVHALEEINAAKEEAAKAIEKADQPKEKKAKKTKKAKK